MSQSPHQEPGTQPFEFEIEEQEEQVEVEEQGTPEGAVSTSSPVEEALTPRDSTPPDRKPAHPVHPSARTHQLVSEVMEEEGSLGVPKRPMHEMVRTSDDENRKRERGMTQEASIEFRPDPELGDAAADLAEELGRNMLGAATSGVDMSELVPPEESFQEEVGGPYIVTGVQAELGEEPEFDLRDVDEKSRRHPGK